MHFLFTGAIQGPECRRRASPAVAAASETPPASPGARQVSRALANVLNIYAKENLSGLFAKSGCLYPFLSWPCARGARSVDGAPSSPSMHPAPALQANCGPGSWPGPGSRAAGTRGASVASPGPAGAPPVAMTSQGPLVSSESSQSLTWQAQDKGCPLEPGET